MVDNEDRSPLIRDAPLNRRAVLRLGVALPVIGAVAVAAGRHGAAAALTASPTAACAGSPVATPTAPAPAGSPVAAVTVRMTPQLRFDPPAITVKVGQTVTWINASPLPHTATDDPAKNPVATTHPDYAQLPVGASPWSSELLQPGQSYRQTFTVPGEYQYFCIPHVLSGMRGTITVTG